MHFCKKSFPQILKLPLFSCKPAGQAKGAGISKFVDLERLLGYQGYDRIWKYLVLVLNVPPQICDTHL